jgi:DNA-directed RNA polymerase specialized sigma24 family protein
MSLLEDIRAWYVSGDKKAGTRLVEQLAGYVALPPSFGRALSEAAAEEVEQEALIRLVDRERRVLDGRDDPFAYAATVSRNLARDELRRQRRRGELADARESMHEPQVPSHEGTAPEFAIDAERALALLDDLGEDSRFAVFLVHAPDRMPEEDWVILTGRQPSSGNPPRPDRPLDRDEASRWLWPPPNLETRMARRQRLERIRKVLERAYSKLAQALGAS